MELFKEVNRSGLVALSPDEGFLAAGTMAGTVDETFSLSGKLEIFRLDLSSDDREMPLVESYRSPHRFSRLSWGKNDSVSKSRGLVAGGLFDGEIHLWSENQSATVLVRHKGPVRGLEFHTTEPNLLASGAEDGQICIWDLANALEPKDSASQGEISFLSWNSQVQHILASTSYDGTMVVWDTKNLKQVISFADSVRRRCSILQWNPDIPTQLIIASEDDSPLRLWDLRFTMAPIMEFVGHTRGVIGMTWCPNDGASLLTCGKDSRTICWNTISGEGGGQIAYELPTGTRWNFDVHWCPETPGVISASSFDGRIDGVISACSFEGKIGMYKIKAAGDGADDDDNGDDGDSGIDGTRAADVCHVGNIDGVDDDDGDNGIDGTSTADVCHVGEVSVSSLEGEIGMYNVKAADGNSEDETSGTETGTNEESYLEGTEEDDEEESEEDDEEESEENDEEESENGTETSEESGSSSEESFRQFSDDDINMDGTEEDDEDYFDDEYNPRPPFYYDDEYNLRAPSYYVDYYNPRAPVAYAGPVNVAFGHPSGVADSDNMNMEGNEEDEDFVEEYDFDALADYCSIYDPALANVSAAGDSADDGAYGCGADVDGASGGGDADDGASGRGADVDGASGGGDADDGAAGVGADGDGASGGGDADDGAAGVGAGNA